MKKLHITSIWFPIAFVFNLLEHLLSQSKNVLGLIIWALLTLLFCFLKPNKKRTPIFLGLLSIISLISMCGLFTVPDLCNFLTFFSLCLLSLAPFLKNDKLLSCKYVVVASVVCLHIYDLVVNLYVAGKYIFTTPYPYIFLFSLAIAYGISSVLAFYQLSEKFYHAGQGTVSVKVY